MTVSILALLSSYHHTTFSLSPMSRGMGLFCQAGMVITNTDIMTHLPRSSVVVSVPSREHCTLS